MSAEQTTSRALLFQVLEMLRALCTFSPPDPRTNVLPLVGNPFYGIAIIGFYLYFVLNLGPRLMRDREPFQLKALLTVFDIFQIVSSVVIFYKVRRPASPSVHSSTGIASKAHVCFVCFVFSALH